jgi:CubicO group peptidase (beta-lactamase class C family)
VVPWTRLADVAAKTPITEDTVFRIGSITKTFTAVAVMQLWEKGLIDLDAPATTTFRPSGYFYASCSSCARMVSAPVSVTSSRKLPAYE